MSYSYLQEQKGWCSPWLQVRRVKQQGSHLCCLLNSAGKNIHHLILHWAHLDPNDYPAVSWGMCTNVLLFCLFPHAGVAPLGAPVWRATGLAPALMKVSIKATQARASSSSPWTPWTARPCPAPYISATVGLWQCVGKQ